MTSARLAAYDATGATAREVTETRANWLSLLYCTYSSVAPVAPYGARRAGVRANETPASELRRKF